MARRETTTAAIALGLGLALAGCGGAPSTNRSGTYRGPNTLEFSLVQPHPQQMPPEENQGSAEVIDNDETYLTLELRMFDRGEPPCRISARRTGLNTLDVTPGQRCSSRFDYQGIPVAAEVRIDRGEATFRDGRLLVILEGNFAGQARTPAGVQAFTGEASWRFEGAAE
ncbi:MAG: hypothetical protein ACFCGT_00440 [Sandaracinaceae bacterium]